MEFVCSTHATVFVVGTEESPIERLSQRELRNESGRVLRAVSEGSSFILTNAEYLLVGSYRLMHRLQH